MAASMIGVPLYFMMMGQLFGLGGAGLPIGVPPQEFRPELYSMAPEDCLAYMASAGSETPDPTSENSTEQLMAEPEIQEFLAEVDRIVLSAVDALGREEGETERQAAGFAYQAALAGLTSPWMIYLEDLEISSPQEVPVVRGGAAIYLGDQAQLWNARALRLLAANAPDGAVSVQTLRGAAIYTVLVDEDMPKIQWKVSNGYLLAGFGEGALDELEARLVGGTAPPQWLTDGLASTDIPRQSTITYMNVAKIRDLVIGLAEQNVNPEQMDQILQTIDLVGLTNLESIVSATGLDATNFVEEMVLNFNGEPTGLIAALAGGTITPLDLDAVPVDSNVAVAYKVDLDAVLEIAMQIADVVVPAREVEVPSFGGEDDSDPQTMMTPKGSDFVENFCMMAEMQFGIHPINDLLPLLGDTITAYNSPSEGGHFFTGATLSIELTDAERFVEFQTILLEGFMEMDPNFVNIVQTVPFTGGQMYILNIPDEEVPFAPTWAIIGDRLFVSLIPQNIRTIASRGPDFVSLGEHEQIAPLLADGQGPCGLSYMDGSEFVKMFYPFLVYGANYAAGEIERELDVQVNASALPSLSVLMRHWQPSIQTMRLDGNQIIARSSKTFPGSGGIGAAPVAVALLLPATQAAREAARRMESTNNMKQIGIAMHNYHDTFGTFPPAYSTDEDGNPLLSWRVLILPFIEQQALYEQFHLDEPWDSPHNLPLSEIVVAGYQTPGSYYPPNMTHYMTVRDEDSAFPGAEGLRLRDMLDGTSNTIMLVSVGSEAVIWTQPMDWDPEESSFWSLSGLRPGGFNAAFCDGSVHFISTDIDRSVFEALCTKSGGEAASLNSPQAWDEWDESDGDMMSDEAGEMDFDDYMFEEGFDTPAEEFMIEVEELEADKAF